MRWVGHVARMGEVKNAYEIFPFSPFTYNFDYVVGIIIIQTMYIALI
jgi:hypothetical protein